MGKYGRSEGSGRLKRWARIQLWFELPLFITDRSLGRGDIRTVFILYCWKAISGWIGLDTTTTISLNGTTPRAPLAVLKIRKKTNKC